MAELVVIGFDDPQEADRALYIVAPAEIDLIVERLGEAVDAAIAGLPR
jgi:uncharacterized membrane protein